MAIKKQGKWEPECCGLQGLTQPIISHASYKTSEARGGIPNDTYKEIQCTTRENSTIMKRKGEWDATVVRRNPFATNSGQRRMDIISNSPTSHSFPTALSILGLKYEFQRDCKARSPWRYFSWVSRTSSTWSRRILSRNRARSTRLRCWKCARWLSSTRVASYWTVKK